MFKDPYNWDKLKELEEVEIVKPVDTNKLVPLNYLLELQSKLQESVDKSYEILYYGGKLYIRRKGAKGRYFVTTSITKVEEYVYNKVEERIRSNIEV